MFLLVANGGALALQSGALGAVLGGGALPPDVQVYVLRKVHGLSSRAAMVLIALHVLAALYHQFVLRDRLLARMGLGRR